MHQQPHGQDPKRIAALVDPDQISAMRAMLAARFPVEAARARFWGAATVLFWVARDIKQWDVEGMSPPATKDELLTAARFIQAQQPTTPVCAGGSCCAARLATP